MYVYEDVCFHVRMFEFECVFVKEVVLECACELYDALSKIPRYFNLYHMDLFTVTPEDCHMSEIADDGNNQPLLLLFAKMKQHH